MARPVILAAARRELVERARADRAAGRLAARRVPPRGERPRRARGAAGFRPGGGARAGGAIAWSRCGLGGGSAAGHPRGLRRSPLLRPPGPEHGRRPPRRGRGLRAAHPPHRRRGPRRRATPSARACASTEATPTGARRTWRPSTRRAGARSDLLTGGRVAAGRRAARGRGSRSTSTPAPTASIRPRARAARWRWHRGGGSGGRATRSRARARWRTGTRPTAIATPAPSLSTLRGRCKRPLERTRRPLRPPRSLPIAPSFSARRCSIRRRSWSRGPATSRGPSRGFPVAIRRLPTPAQLDRTSAVAAGGGALARGERGARPGRGAPDGARVPDRALRRGGVRFRAWCPSASWPGWRWASVARPRRRASGCWPASTGRGPEGRACSRRWRGASPVGAGCSSSSPAVTRPCCASPATPAATTGGAPTRSRPSWWRRRRGSAALGAGERAAPEGPDGRDARGLPRARSPAALGVELRAGGRRRRRLRAGVPGVPRAGLGALGGGAAAGRDPRRAAPRRRRRAARSHLGGRPRRLLRPQRARPPPGPGRHRRPPGAASRCGWRSRA